MAEKGTVEDEGEESKSGIFAVRSINIEESEGLKEMMNAHWSAFEISSSSCENPRESPFDVGANEGLWG